MTLGLSEYSLSKSIPKLITTPPSPSPSPSPSPEIEYSNKTQLLDAEKTRIHKVAASNTLNLQLLDFYLASEKPNDVQDNYYGLNLLCWACQCRSLDAVIKILQQGGIDINQSNGPHQMTALHIAAAANFIRGIDYLVQQPNLDLNQQDRAGLTALHYTARTNHHDAAKALLEAGARSDLFDKRGKLALHYAIRHHHTSKNILLFLQKRERNNPSWTNLIWAASCSSDYCVMEEAVAVIRDIQIIHQLVRTGAFIAVEHGGWWDDAYNYKRDDLIDLCIHWNRLDCLQYFIQETDITQRVEHVSCQRALHVAVQQRKLDLVIYLCTAVRVCPCDANGYNAAFLYAANHGFMEMIPYLLTPDTSPDCIQQALLFSKMMGEKKPSLDDILQHYYQLDSNLILSKPTAVDISIGTVDEAFNDIFQQVPSQ